MTDEQNKAQRIAVPVPPHTESTKPLLALGSRYEVLDKLGEGGMGVVYQARDRETGDTVAIKVLRAEYAANPAMLERFKNELRLARRITHKNVCRIHDFNRTGEIAYITMEYVDGEDLRAHLRRVGKIPVARTLALASQICDALAEAHAQGVIHRDLKPENVVLSRSGAVKLMDFGIARLLDGGRPATTQTLIGTPAYMAPEQAQGKPADQRTDLYALGLILYECLTGRVAFAGDTPVAIALKQVQEKPVAPRKLAPVISKHVETAILRCLEKDPAKRFLSARALTGALQGQPTTQARSRRRLLWTGATLALAALVAVSVVRKTHHQGPLTPAHASRAVLSEAPVSATTEGPAPIPRAAPRPLSGSNSDAASAGSFAGREPVMRDQLKQIVAAARGGDAEAQDKVGHLLMEGPPRIRDERRARHVFQLAARGGNVDAAYSLAQMYESGRGGPQDLVEAYALYSLAADAGYTPARAARERLAGQLGESQLARAQQRARQMSEKQPR